MQFLLNIYLPSLKLETLRPSWCEPGAFAVMDKEQAVLVSPLAYAAGVRAGMRVGGVATIAPDTVMLERDSIKERRALDAIATTLMQYTPEVTFLDEDSILLDVSASLRLFGGPTKLCQLVRSSVSRLGFSVIIGAAPTANGAWLMAHARRIKKRPLLRRCIQMEVLHRRLDALPYSVLPAARIYSEWLDGIGATNLEAIRRLPRTGLLRRTSKVLVSAIDRAYGHEPEMFQWIRPPDVFSAHVETFDRIEHAEALMVGATGLILQMIGWLCAQQLAVTTFTLSLEHERGRAAVAPTQLEISLAEPAWKEPHLLRLLKERLAKTELSAPVIGLRLDAKQLQPMQPQTDQLFPEPGGTPADFNRLMDLLSARLGEENVLMLAMSSDHRPEACNIWVPAVSKQKRSSELGETLERPAWILPKPIALIVRDNRPLYGVGPLRIIQGPERVEAGWWDNQFVARDYFVAQGQSGECYWIYLEREHNGRWYLHGLYA